MRFRVYDHHEQIPRLGLQTLGRVLVDEAIPFWLRNVPEQLWPHAKRLESFKKGYADDTDELLHRSLGLRYLSPMADMASLVSTPRRMRLLIRGVNDKWSQLAGEVDLLDAIVAEVLLHLAPAAFQFVTDNRVDLMAMNSDLAPYKGAVRTPAADHWRALEVAFKKELHPLPGDLEWRLVEFLFPPPDKRAGGNSEQLARHMAPQGFVHSQPTDYFARWQLRAQVGTGGSGLSDQDIVAAIAGWNAGSGSGALAGQPCLALAIRHDPTVAAKIEQFSSLVENPYRLAGEYLAVARQSGAARQWQASLEIQPTGFFELWRICLRRRDSRPKGWLDGQLRETLVVSLSMAASLLEYWQHEESNGGRPPNIVEPAWIAAEAILRDTFEGQPQRYLDALDPYQPYTTWRLFTRQGEADLSGADMTWFGRLLLDAAGAQANAVVPQVACLLTKTEAGVLDDRISGIVIAPRVLAVFTELLPELAAIVRLELDLTDLPRLQRRHVEAALAALRRYLEKSVVMAAGAAEAAKDAPTGAPMASAAETEPRDSD